MQLQTLLFQTVMDTNAECSEIIKKLGEWLSISTNVEVSGSSLEGIHIL